MSAQKKILQVSVIGAGQMGRGIAQVFAEARYETLLYDPFPEALERGHDFIVSTLKKKQEKGKISFSEMDSTLQCLKTVKRLEDLATADLIVEAIPEERPLKLDLFKKLDAVVKKGGILATNTSSLSITEMASMTSRPSLVVGMHFMNPVPVMNLIEGVVGSDTSEETWSIVEETARTLNKTLVKSKDFPGFIVNRILMPMINEAFYVLHEQLASPKDIDTAMKLGTNVPMGPLELADFIGLDTCLHILNVLHEGLGDPKYRPCPLLKNYVLAKRFGRKSGQGVFSYR